MLKVAILDSDEQYREQTARILFHLFFDVEDVSFTYYESGANLIEDVLNNNFKHDLLLTELSVGGVSGFKMLEFMRKRGVQTDIIVITAAVEQAVFGYRLHVFDFIEKPISLPKMEDVVNRYVHEKMKPAEDFLSVSIQGCRQRLRLGKISFFESRVRKVIAVMDNETIEFYHKMNDLEEELSQKGFLRCHQSYIVNCSYVIGMEYGELLLINKKRIPVSRRYSQVVRETLERQKLLYRESRI